MHRKHADEELAALSWKKSEEERVRGVLLGPYGEIDDLPISEVSLCWRKAVWKSRRGAERSARNVDDGGCSGLPAQMRTRVFPSIPFEGLPFRFSQGLQAGIFGA